MKSGNRERKTKAGCRKSAAPYLASVLCLLSSVLSPAAESKLGDAAKLPPPAKLTVDFDRDVWPILEKSCLRCHGREKPKSGFRLDSRDAALRGGENGVDILPGDSGKSPLIHYVARAVPDMEMPPKGKGDPLTTEQVALLRAWIDQGVKWGRSGTDLEPSSTITPTLRYITVDGDRQKFRELNWQKGGWSGGVGEFESHERTNDIDVTIRGHVLWDENDFGVSFDVRRPDVGFLRAGVEQFRKYFDDSGCYYPGFTTPQFSLDRDLHLDSGRAWIDFGLTLPDVPKMTLGYEYQWRHGSRSILQWGPVTQGLESDGVTPRSRNIYPAAKDISERVHIVKFDFDHTIADWRIEDNFRGEFYDLKTSRGNVTGYDLASPGVISGITIRERERSFTGANVFQVEKQLTDWLFASGGYLYSKLHADGSFALDGETLPGRVEAWRSREIVLERESHVFNLNGVLGPWSGFTLALGAQAEWTRQEGMSGLDISITQPFIAASTVAIDSDLDTARVQESAVLRFTRIPYTTLYAEARIEQESISQFEEQSPGSFMRDTDATSDARDLRVGFSTSPWKEVTWSAHCRRLERDSQYDHRLDVDFDGSTTDNGYSAFIRSRRIATDEVETRLAFRPANWLRATVSYKLQATDYHTETDSYFVVLSPGGEIFAGNYDAHIYGLNLAFTGIRNLYLAGTLTYQDVRSITAQNGVLSIVPYRGDIWSLLLTANYTVNARIDLLASYNFSRGDFAQANAADGLPLGIDYTQHSAQGSVGWKVNKNLRTRVGYGFFRYEEPTSAGLNNYTAHMIFTSLNWRIP